MIGNRNEILLDSLLHNMTTNQKGFHQKNLALSGYYLGTLWDVPKTLYPCYLWFHQPRCNASTISSSHSSLALQLKAFKYDVRTFVRQSARKPVRRKFEPCTMYNYYKTALKCQLVNYFLIGGNRFKSPTKQLLGCKVIIHKSELYSYTVIQSEVSLKSLFYK